MPHRKDDYDHGMERHRGRESNWERSWDRYPNEEDFRDMTGYDSDETYEDNLDIYISGPFEGMGPRGYQRSEEAIRDDVCDRLTQHGFLDARKIQVEVQKGIVTLNGEVEDRNQKRMAEDTAQSVYGVFDVDNRLRVRRGGPRSRTTMRDLYEQARGREDWVGHTGVYPMSGPWPEEDAPVLSMADWSDQEEAQESHGTSELRLGDSQHRERK